MLIPAIDIYNSQVVRLFKGDVNQKTVYFDNPLLIAEQFKKLNFNRIHIVDLNGAIDGNKNNLELVKKIADIIPIQFGGGLRTENVVKDMYAIDNIKFLIVSTKILHDSNFVDIIKNKYKDKILVSIDYKKNKIYTQGWKKSINSSINDVLKQLENDGFKNLILTNIDRDGTMKGPDLSSIKELTSRFSKINFYIAGGIRNLSDIDDVMKIDTNIKGVISGKAVYENMIDGINLKTGIN